MFSGRQFKLFKLAGIQVYLHWSWFFVALYEIESRAGAYSNIGWNVLEYLALFAIVTTHEFGHALACRSVGGSPDRIMLWPLGGVAYVDPPQRPGATLWSIAAGPLVNVALLPVFWLTAQIPVSVAGFNGALFLRNVEWINLGLLIFNILPVYPLDGGQILRSLLWYPMGRARSLMTASILGFIGVAAFGVYAALSESLWMLAISAFIAYTCWSGFKQAQFLNKVAKLPRRDQFFACPSCHTAPPIGGYWRCPHCGQGYDAFVSQHSCAACGQMLPAIRCLDCGRVYPQQDWHKLQPA